MNRRVAMVVAAALVLAGSSAVVVPQHAASAARVLAATVAVATGTMVLVAVARVAGREVPVTALDRPPAPTAAPLDPHGLRDARRDLGARCAPGSVPRAVWDRLRTATPAPSSALAPATSRLLDQRPPAGARPDPERVAAVVHRVLDDLDPSRQGR